MWKFVVSKWCEYRDACGPWWVVPRFALRSWISVVNRGSARIWALAFRELGDDSIVERGIAVSDPKHVTIGSQCRLASGCRLSSVLPGRFLVLGDGVDINRNVHIDFSGGVDLGPGTLVSEGSVPLSHSHGYDPRSTPTASALTVGRNVWIGSHALITDRVSSVGDGAIIASGAIVTRNVGAGEIVASPSARPISSRVD